MRAATAEATCQQYENAFHHDRQRWLDSYRDLLEKYHALKLQGAAPAIPDLPVRQPLSTDLADEEAAMDEESKPVEVGPFRDDD